MPRPWLSAVLLPLTDPATCIRRSSATAVITVMPMSLRPRIKISLTKNRQSDALGAVRSSGRRRRLCVATPVPTMQCESAVDRPAEKRPERRRPKRQLHGAHLTRLQPRGNLRTSKCHHHKIPGAATPFSRGFRSSRPRQPVSGLKRWPDGEHWRGVFPCPGILSSRNSKSYLRMAPWRSRSSPRAATTPSADCPIAVTSLNLVSCRRTLASDMPDRAAEATITQPRAPKFVTWHSASPQKPQGGAGQDDASEAGQR